MIFAKSPSPGIVKTRLAKSIGVDDALKFYKYCAENIFKECLKIKLKFNKVNLFYAANSDVSEIKK